MLTRAFHVVGLIVRIAEWKVSLLAFAARRSAIAMLGYLIAAIVALGGMGVLLGAGYVALEPVVGVPLAMAAVGVCLLLAASTLWVIANRRGRSTGHSISEHDAWTNVARDEELLRSMLGMNNIAPKTGSVRPGPRIHPSPQSDSAYGFDDPKVVVAAAFAMLSLLGPFRILRVIRTATAVASVAALANRAINEHRDKEGTDRAP